MRELSVAEQRYQAVVAGSSPAPLRKAASCLPPQFIDVPVVGSLVEDVLGALLVERVCGGRGLRFRGADGGADVAEVPSIAVPPQLLDEAVCGLVEDMLGVLGREYITGQMAVRQ